MSEPNLGTKTSDTIGWDRIRSMTPAYVNERIQRQMEGEIEHLKGQGRDAIQRRIFELEREWNIDQALMANFAVVASAGVAAGALRSRKWLWAPMVQFGFLFLHASRGWCPPSALFRRLGFRSQKEIEAQRYILLQHLKSLVQEDRSEERPTAA
jgi:hypothetical protein